MCITTRPSDGHYDNELYSVSYDITSVTVCLVIKIHKSKSDRNIIVRARIRLYSAILVDAELCPLDTYLLYTIFELTSLFTT